MIVEGVVMSKGVQNYISMYKNTFSKEKCQNLIDKFEKYTEFHDVKKIDAKDGWQMSFTQLHLSKHKEFEVENRELKSLFLKAISIYRKEHEIQLHQWPKEFQLEPIRMKRYLPNSNDKFDEHVEVTNLETAKRFLVVLLYLNDDFEGGETDFVQFKAMVKPKQGSIALFPATWNWLHRGKAVIGGSPKYIVGTLLHYV